MKKILTVFTLLLAFVCFSDLRADNMCSSTLGVEPSISGSNLNTKVTVSFRNTNDYKVTVDASITLCDEDGQSVTLSRVPVIGPKETATVTVTNQEVGLGTFKPALCSVGMQVWKCD